MILFRTSCFVFPTEIRFTIHASLNRPLQLSRNLYKSPLFMQNKPNFPDTQMSINIYCTKIYSDDPAFRRGQNKPNSNPIQTQTNPIAAEAKMGVNVSFTRTCDNNPAPPLRQNKANSKPIFKKPRISATIYYTTNYENDPLRSRPESRPNRTRPQPDFVSLPEGIPVAESVFGTFDIVQDLRFRAWNLDSNSLSTDHR